MLYIDLDNTNHYQYIYKSKWNEKRNFLAKQYCHGWIIQISRVVLYEKILKLSCIRKNILVKNVYQVTSKNELGSFLNMSHWAKWDKTIIYCV